MAKGKENWLVFVDTNILLDFYRIGGESAERQLQALEKHKEVLITGEQVRMEFLKHRQKVIIETMKQIVAPSRPLLPPIIRNYEHTKMWMKHNEIVRGQVERVKNKIEKILQNPGQNDPVYQVLTRIFDNNSLNNLKRPSEDRFEIRELATKRFLLCYPPRKKMTLLLAMRLTGSG
jgi:predicted nucleic acid-binding protein